MTGEGDRAGVGADQQVPGQPGRLTGQDDRAGLGLDPQVTRQGRRLTGQGDLAAFTGFGSAPDLQKALVAGARNERVLQVLALG